MTLLDIPPRRILGRFLPIKLPPAGSFKGLTVLITGGTSGLGLAAALHFVHLGADVLITCRDPRRGEKAREHIEAAAGGKQDGKVVGVFELDMSSYASCETFLQNLKEWFGSRGVRGGLDIAVLNAGRIDPHFSLSPEGWEQTIQVNALSTTLLGLLLVAWMRNEKRMGNRDKPAHLVFVTSRDHLYPDLTHWLEWADEDERGILGHLSDPNNWPSIWETTEPNYGNSKTLVMHAIQEISKLATSGENGDLCPGLVNSEISRYIANQSWYARLLTPLYMTIGGKSPDMGARFYVKAAMRDEKDHGKFSNGWLTEEQYNRKAQANMTSAHARKVHTQVWQEICNDLLAKMPKLADHLPEMKAE